MFIAFLFRAVLQEENEKLKSENKMKKEIADFLEKITVSQKYSNEPIKSLENDLAMKVESYKKLEKEIAQECSQKYSKEFWMDPQKFQLITCIGLGVSTCIGVCILFLIFLILLLLIL